MIAINDNDMPITVAEKLITGTKPYNPTEVVKKLSKLITGDESSSDTMDMFSVEELQEIARYLMVFCDTHKETDDK